MIRVKTGAGYFLHILLSLNVIDFFTPNPHSTLKFYDILIWALFYTK